MNGTAAVVLGLVAAVAGIVLGVMNFVGTDAPETGSGRALKVFIYIGALVLLVGGGGLVLHGLVP